MAKILIPTPLRQFAGKHDSVELPGATVGEVLKSLTTEYADLRRHLYNDEGKLRSFVNVYVNDDDIRYLNKEATPLKDGDTVSIVPSIAGGSAGVAAPPASLSKDEILRYSRHLIMPEVGMEGQLKLKNAKVARADWERRSACISPRRGSGESGWWISTSSISPTCSGR
jgi:adenylyltransferase/sulfurtransferase